MVIQTIKNSGQQVGEPTTAQERKEARQQELILNQQRERVLERLGRVFKKYWSVEALMKIADRDSDYSENMKIAAAVALADRVYTFSNGETEELAEMWQWADDLMKFGKNGMSNLLAEKISGVESAARYELRDRRYWNGRG